MKYLFSTIIHVRTVVAGQQMEEKGIEWVCPNCLKKKAEEEKAKSSSQVSPVKQKTKVEPTSDNAVSQAVLSPKETSSTVSSADYAATVPISGTMQCVVCKKEARNSSIYCSDACILAHAQETLTKDKPAKSPVIPETTVKPRPEARVIVFDRKTGKVLTGK